MTKALLLIGTSFKMVKFAISVFVVAQLCILQAQASHYIQFKIIRGNPFTHQAGVCIRDGTKVHMSDYDTFGSGVKNYGFHKDGWSATVNWDREEVNLHGYGVYKFDKGGKDGSTLVWEGCWDTNGDPNVCRNFRDAAENDCFYRLLGMEF